MVPAMHRQARRVVHLALPFVLTLVTAIVVVGSPAYACSCARRDLRASLHDAEGAFVGLWMDRAEIGGGQAAVTFEVERVVKGSFGPKAIVRTVADGSACGLEQLGVERTGLLLRRGTDGAWESDLCWMVTPSELLAADRGHPPDPGIAPIGVGWSAAAKGAAMATLGAVLILLLAWFASRRVGSPGQSPVA